MGGRLDRGAAARSGRLRDVSIGKGAAPRSRHPERLLLRAILIFTSSPDCLPRFRAYSRDPPRERRHGFFHTGSALTLPQRMHPSPRLGVVMNVRLLTALAVSLGGSLSACEPEPRTVIHGDVVIDSPNDVKALRSVHTIEGRLQVRGAFSGALVLDELAEVHGGLEVSAKGVTRVSLPALVRVGPATKDEADPEEERPVDYSQVRITSTHNLVQFDCPKLTHSGSIVVTDNAALAELSLPVLQDVVDAVGSIGSLHVENNAALVRVSAPRLGQLAQLALTDNHALQDVSLESLHGELPDDLYVYSNDRLNRLSLPKVEGVDWTLIIEDALTELNLPALRTGRVEIHAPNLEQLNLSNLTDSTLGIESQRLTTLDLPKLAQAHPLTLISPALEHLRLPSLEGLGCGSMQLDFTLPDCALKDVVPKCSPEHVAHLEHCTCAPDGNLREAMCD
jgi:hypothetical protein